MLKTFFKKKAIALLYYIGYLPYVFKKDMTFNNGHYIRVVNYHDVKSGEEKAMEAQIKWLAKYYEIISYSKFKCLVNNSFDIIDNKKPFLLITFDDGLEGNYNPLLKILKKYSVPAVFFICPGLIGKKDYMSKEQIAECINSKLVDIGCHTFDHVELTRFLNTKDYYHQILDSKTSLEELFSVKIDSFCWPFGRNESYSVKANKIILESNYQYVFCTYSDYIMIPDNRNFYLPRTNLQLSWNKAELIYHLSSKHDKKFASRKSIIENCYIKASS